MAKLRNPFHSLAMKDEDVEASITERKYLNAKKKNKWRSHEIADYNEYYIMLRHKKTRLGTLVILNKKNADNSDRAA